MLKYTTILSKKATKQLDKMQDNIAQPILNAISALQHNPRPHGYLKLKDRDGHRIWVGSYRVIYDIQDTVLIVEVIAVGKRGDIYDD